MQLVRAVLLVVMMALLIGVLPRSENAAGRAVTSSDLVVKVIGGTNFSVERSAPTDPNVIGFPAGDKNSLVIRAKLKNTGLTTFVGIPSSIYFDSAADGPFFLSGSAGVVDGVTVHEGDGLTDVPAVAPFGGGFTLAPGETKKFVLHVIWGMLCPGCQNTPGPVLVPAPCGETLTLLAGTLDIRTGTLVDGVIEADPNVAPDIRLAVAGPYPLTVTVVCDLQAQTFKIKAAQGNKANPVLAVDDASGSVLVAFESKGEILATLAKPGANGKFAAKKAKRISGGGGDNHRPTVAFDPSVNEFLAAWDTGPGDLSAAADGSDPGASEILSRRINRTKGKPIGGVVTTVSDDRLNIGPNLGVRLGGVEVFYTSHDRPSMRNRLNLSARLVRNLVQGGVVTGSPQQMSELREGLSWMLRLSLHAEDACAVFTRYLFENPYADYVFMDVVDGVAEYLESSHDMTPALGAFMYFLDELDYKVQAWYEYGPPRSQRKVNFEFVGLDGEVSPSQTLDGNVASNMVGASQVNARAGTGDRAWVAEATVAGQIRLLEIGGAAEVFQTVMLFERKKEITEMSLIVLQDQRAMLVWVERKNKKKQDIWVHVFTLP